MQHYIQHYRPRFAAHARELLLRDAAGFTMLGGPLRDAQESFHVYRGIHRRLLDLLRLLNRLREHGSRNHGKYQSSRSIRKHAVHIRCAAYSADVNSRVRSAAGISLHPLAF